MGHRRRGGDAASITASSTSSCATPRSTPRCGRSSSTRSAATRCARALPWCACSTASISHRDRPLAVVVDDAQWADGASLQALVFAARRLRRDPVLLCLVVRAGASTNLPLPTCCGSSTTPVVGSSSVPSTARPCDSWPRARAARSSRVRWPSACSSTRGATPCTWCAPRRDGPERAGLHRRAPVAATVRQPRAVQGGVHVAGRPGPRRSGGGAGRPGPVGRGGGRRRRGRARRGGRRGGGEGLLALDGGQGASAPIRSMWMAHPLVRAAVLGGLSLDRRAELHRRAGVALGGAVGLRHRLLGAVGGDGGLWHEAVAEARRQDASGAHGTAAELLALAVGVATGQAEREATVQAALDEHLMAGQVREAEVLRAAVHASEPSSGRSYSLGRAAYVIGPRREAPPLLADAWHRLTGGDDPCVPDGLGPTEREAAGRVAAMLATVSVDRARGRRPSAGPGSPWSSLPSRRRWPALPTCWRAATRCRDPSMTGSGSSTGCATRRRRALGSGDPRAVDCHSARGSAPPLDPSAGRSRGRLRGRAWPPAASAVRSWPRRQPASTWPRPATGRVAGTRPSSSPSSRPR